MKKTDAFTESLKKGVHMKFYTKYPHDTEYYGVVVHERRKYVILAVDYDFEFDGFLMILKSHISKVRPVTNNKCYARILKSNGCLKKMKLPKYLSQCETGEEVVKALKKAKVWAAFHEVWETKSGVKKDCVQMGEILNVGKTLDIRRYGADGKWSGKWSVDWGELFAIEFKSMYCRHFNTYMRS